MLTDQNLPAYSKCASASRGGWVQSRSRSRARLARDRLRHRRHRARTRPCTDGSDICLMLPAGSANRKSSGFTFRNASSKPRAFIQTVARERVTQVMLVLSQIVALLNSPRFSCATMGSFEMTTSKNRQHQTHPFHHPGALAVRELRALPVLHVTAFFMENGASPTAC